MGLYGSPDTGNLYTKKEEEKKKKRKIKISLQSIFLIVLYLILILPNDDKFTMTISFIGVISMVYFLINFFLMIYKLIKKQSVNNEVIKLLICVVLFIICGILS